MPSRSCAGTFGPLVFMTSALIALGCATTPPAGPPRPDTQLAGTWSGAVALPTGALLFTARIGEDGAGTIDVPQQYAKDLPLRVLRSEGSAFEMSCDVPGAPAVLTGKHEGNVLRGTFAQRGYEFPFELRRDRQALSAPPAPTTRVVKPELLKGPWHGAVVVGAQHLLFDIVFDVSATSGTFAVPSQGLRGVKLEQVVLDDDALTFRVTLPGAQQGVFDGTLREGRVDGTYAQGSGRSPFFMERGERPDPPKAAVNEHFQEQEVLFSHGSVTLSGTLTLPRNVERPPVAVLISGSGPQDRDEEVAGFRVFESLAHELAKGGVATLRYDDRGTGRSTGDFVTSTTADFADDAEAAVRFLMTRADVDTTHVGLIGHSEGAVVAPMVAARSQDVAFVVLLAPAAQPLGDLIVDQVASASRAEGLPAETIERHQRLMRKAVALLQRDRDLSSLEAELGRLRRTQMETPWFRALVKLDPAPFLERVKVPTLAIAGGLDVQVPGETNLPRLRAIAAKSSGTFIVEEIAGMNHLLQAAKTGAVSEYANLPKALEPKVVDRILTGVRITLHGSHATGR